MTEQGNGPVSPGTLVFDIRHLNLFYGKHQALKDINMQVKRNEITALIGPSGCGKTTLLHILLGIVKADSGTVKGFSGKRFSAVFQENRLFEFLTAAENVEVVQRKPQNPEKIREILKEILPEASLDQKTGEFSGGMKRRAAIARAMLADSDVIVMDEPLTGLDETTRNQVISFILKYRRDRTLLFSTHQEKEVELFHAEKILLV